MSPKRLLFVLQIVAFSTALSQYLEVRRPATLREQPDRDAAVVEHAPKGVFLELLDSGTQVNGYYKVRARTVSQVGWIYRTLVRRYEGNMPASSAEALPGDTLTICSFNIQFLGSFKKRDNSALADLLRGYDIVVVQELVAPPVNGNYPGGGSYSADDESAAFFDAMENQGFEYLLSSEDTGTSDVIHTSATSTEWWVAFFKPGRVSPAANLPSGFLAEDRSNNDDYERVPYAFAFRSSNDKVDFVLISVHLMPGGSNSSKNRRHHELSSIATWIDAHDQKEKDFIILGDMNIEDISELNVDTPPGFRSLNDECRKTNTIMTPGSGKPFDHVMYDTVHTTNKIDRQFDLQVVDLIRAMRPHWSSNAPYAGDPYVHDLFRQYYSDHHPVVFKMVTPAVDDD